MVENIEKDVCMTIPNYVLIYHTPKNDYSKRSGRKKFFEATYLNAKKRRPLFDSEDWIERAELQGNELTGSYKNCTQ